MHTVCEQFIDMLQCRNVYVVSNARKVFYLTISLAFEVASFDPQDKEKSQKEKGTLDHGEDCFPCKSIDQKKS